MNGTGSRKVSVVASNRLATTFTFLELMKEMKASEEADVHW